MKAAIFLIAGVLSLLFPATKPLGSPAVDQAYIVVWFEDQYLEAGDDFLKKTDSFKGQNRSSVRQEVMRALQAMSEASFKKVQPSLEALKDEGLISGLKRHWIINGFSCQATEAGQKALVSLPGIGQVFLKPAPSVARGSNQGPEYLVHRSPARFDLQAVNAYPWNLEKIQAPEVWKEFGVTGKGVLNIVHDSGFKLDVPPLSETIYTHPGEVPGNGKDDDGNGYIDDYHGYHFDEGQANLNQPLIRRGTNIHGNLCAALISGTFATDRQQAVGLAPGSQWAPVIASSNIEQAVEWAIEQGADTYSMSFSLPNLGEYRSHWRKVLEHGTLCGVVFISGAGNFAAGPRAEQVPVQMRIPEDIPHAVLGVAGVGEDGQRPAFSSQGPVVWETEHYQDGEVNKPDFCTINHRVPVVDPEGHLLNQASGNSLSGPHLAGIVALMLSANPELLPWEIKEILVEVAQDIGKEGFDFQHGHGFVNAYEAVKAVKAR